MCPSATDLMAFGLKYWRLGSAKWACGLYAPAATAVEAVQSWAHQAQPLCTPAAVPPVKRAAGVSSCSAAHTGKHSPGHCPSGDRRVPVLYYACCGTDARGRYTQHESHSGASSGASSWSSGRYLLKTDCAGLLSCWTLSSVRHQHVAPELQLRNDSKRDYPVRYFIANIAEMRYL